MMSEVPRVPASVTIRGETSHRRLAGTCRQPSEACPENPFSGVNVSLKVAGVPGNRFCAGGATETEKSAGGNTATERFAALLPRLGSKVAAATLKVVFTRPSERGWYETSTVAVSHSDKAPT